MPATSVTPKKNQVAPGVTALAVLLVVLFVGWMAYRNFGPAPHPVLPDNVHSPNADWIRQKAQESGGDISKLSPAEQLRLQALTQGKGVAYLKKYAHPQ